MLVMIPPGRHTRWASAIMRRGSGTTLRLSDVLDRQALHVDRQWKTSPRSLFTIVVARNAKALRAASVPTRRAVALQASSSG